MPEPWIEKTQAELGVVISTPKLSEKLLGKPPFRFLHDVVMNFIKATGFPANYYDPDMLDSAKCTDKESKLAFLTQLIAVVEKATGKKTTCRPGKTIAGAEPEGTNDLLQLLASCASLSAEEKSAAVSALKGGAAPAPAPAPAPVPAPTAPPAGPTPEEDAAKEKERAERKAKERAERKAKEAAAAAAAKEKEKEEKEKESRAAEAARAKEAEGHDRAKEAEERDRAIAAAAAKAVAKTEDTPVESAPEEEKHTESKRTVDRARPPPKRKTTEEDTSGANNKVSSGVITEGKRGSTEMAEPAGEGKDWMQIVEEHERNQERLAAAVSGDTAKGYLGQQALKAKQQQEEAAKREAEQASSGSGLILKTRRSDHSGAALGVNELQKLREQLQMLTKASNPLGKFLEAIHEDIDTMSRELEMWRTEARTQAVAAMEAQRQTEDSLHEVQGQLQNVEDTINDQLLKTNIVRRSIINREQTIDTMIRMVVNPDLNRKQ